MIFPYFDTTVARLIALDPAIGEEIELYSDGGYAYARVTEAADGSAIFSRVQDTAVLKAAVENGVLTAENWRSYLSTVDVYVISPASTEAALRLIDAAQYTPAN